MPNEINGLCNDSNNETQIISTISRIGLIQLSRSVDVFKKPTLARGIERFFSGDPFAVLLAGVVS